MVDMHAHILPGADHGSQSVEMSLELMDAAIEAGIDTIVATPHFYLRSPNSYSHFVAARSKAYRLLDASMGEERKSRCKLRLGAEVNLRFGLATLAELPELCIENTNIILLEMPMDKVWPSWTYNEVADIIEKRGLRPLMAHIDRYECANVEKLFDYFPLIAQINVESVVPFFKRRKIMRYFEEGYVYALGSDVHRSCGEYQNFARSVKYLQPYIEQITKRSRMLLGQENKELEQATLK